MSQKLGIAKLCLGAVLAGAGSAASAAAQTEPAQTDPALTGPALTGPTQTIPAQTGPAAPGDPLAGPAASAGGADNASLANNAGVTDNGQAQRAPAPALIGEDEETDEILFEADSVYREVEDGPIIAEGDVRAFFGERYLRADRLIYNPATDVVVAEGNVSITDENLETAFAGRVQLSGDLRDGLSENFSALLEDNARLAAQSAIQEQGARTRLNRAVYTACDICDNDGDKKTPTWRIRSLKVTRDRERRVMRFHHSFLEIKGVPIAYAPFLQAPDPSVERQSGFLPPNIEPQSDRLGFNFQLPYYLAISNSQDATFAPLYTAQDGVLWQGEWRRRGRNSYHVLAGGIIDSPNEFPEPTNRGGEGLPGVRWHYFGRGAQQLSDSLRLSYDVERVSDDEYLRNYAIERRGDLRQTLNRGAANQLRSNARLTWNSGGSTLTADSYLFQGLRGALDDATTTPLVLPLIDYRYDFSSRIAGGRASIGTNFAALQRTGGLDSRRLTANATWEREVITKGGHRFNLFGELRGDIYNFDDVTTGTEINTFCENSRALDCTTALANFVPDEDSNFEARFAPTAGVEWSYPLSRQLGGARLFLEPRVQLLASPSGLNRTEIINEDSQSIEFDYAGLFDYNKSTGFDAFEDGQRANIGISASAVWNNGFVIDGAIGQQLRVQDTRAFEAAAGLGDTSSDVVGSLNLRYGSLVGIENRFRLDNADASIERAESSAFLNTGRLRLNAGYVRLIEDDDLAFLNNLARRQELTAAARLRVLRHWSVGAGWRRDLETNQTIRQDFIINYEDECSTFGVTLRRDETRVGNVEPNTAVLVQFTLKSLVN